MIVDGKVAADSKSAAASENDYQSTASALEQPNQQINPPLRAGEFPPTAIDSESVVTDVDVADFPPHNPPAYDSIGATSPFTNPTSTLPRSSHIYTHNQNGSVKLSHIIDLAHQVPVGALPPLEKGETEEKRLNGKFSSHNGSVNVQLGVAHSGLTGERPKGTRVRIGCRSSNGGVTVKIIERTSGLPFKVTAHSQNGSVTVFLPRDFHGPIRMKTGNGSFNFSQEITAASVTINGSKKDGLVFIGDMTNWKGKSSVEDPEENVIGDGLDEAILSSQNGSVKLRFFEDKEDPTVSGFISDVKGFGVKKDGCFIM